MTSMREKKTSSVMSRYLADIHGQPAALRDLAERLAMPGVFAPLIARWRALGRPRVVLTGMGASLFAAQAAAAQVASDEVAVEVIATAQLLEQHAPLDGALVIAVSQSGESVEIRELLSAVPSDQIGAITNGATSSLCRAVRGCLVLGVKPDRSVAIKTYTATLAALALTLRAMAGQSLGVDEVVDAANTIERSVARWSTQAIAASGNIAAARSITLLGWGAMAATAREAALIFKEGARTPAEGMHADDFRHGSVEVVDDRLAAIVFANTNVARSDPWAAVDELARLTRRVIVIGGSPPADLAARVTHISTIATPGLESLLTDVVPVQLLAAHLASHAGFEAGEFRNTTPVIRERPPGRLASVWP